MLLLGLLLNNFCHCFGSATSLSEKDVLVTSLEEQLREVREQMTTDEVSVYTLAAYQSKTALLLINLMSIGCHSLF